MRPRSAVLGAVLVLVSGCAHTLQTLPPDDDTSRGLSTIQQAVEQMADDLLGSGDVPDLAFVERGLLGPQLDMLGGAQTFDSVSASVVGWDHDLGVELNFFPTLSRACATITVDRHPGAPIDVREIPCADGVPERPSGNG